MKKLSFGDEAKRILTDGYVLALPTETVYGLGVRWDDEAAYKRLYEAKLRKPTKPIAVMCGTNFNLDAHFEISDGAMRVIKKFLPGPLTVLVKAKSNVPFQAHLGTNVVGIRIPGKKELLDFLETLPFPLQVTSANISGKPPLTKCEDVIQAFELNENIKGIVEGDCESSIPTTVVDLTGEKPVVIRKGEILEDEINETFRKN